MSTVHDGSDSLIPNEHRTSALFCHLSHLAAYILPAFGFIVGPVVAWLVTRDRHPLVDRAGRNALNFGITMTIATFAAILFIILTLGIGALLVVPLAIALPVVHIIVTIIACIRTTDGQTYEYPLTIKFL